MRNPLSRVTFLSGNSQVNSMTEKVGEIVRATGDYICERCHTHTRFVKDDVFSKCPHCGYDTFDIFNARFEKKDGTLGPHEPEPDGT